MRDKRLTAFVFFFKQKLKRIKPNPNEFLNLKSHLSSPKKIHLNFL